jgi:hypothetical protein
MAGPKWTIAEARTIGFMSTLVQASPSTVDGNGNGSAMKDPASAENRVLPVHRWVPWIAGFSAPFVSHLLDRYVSNGKPTRPIVLDPFCGVGTTLVAAQLHGADSIGFEINPYAALASKVKTRAFEVDVPTFTMRISEYRQFMECFEGDIERMGARCIEAFSSPPEAFRTRIPFFSELVMWRVLATREFIMDLPNGAIHDLFLAGFGAVMVKFSNYSYEPSLATRPGAGKPLIETAPVADIVTAKLEEMRDDIVSTQVLLRDLPSVPTANVWQESFFSAGEHVEPESVDFVVTSPPYLNNYHYVRNTRPQLWWLDLVSDSTELLNLEQASMGKFWQTVRGSDPIDLTVPLPELQDVLETIRKRNVEKRSYGGPGWGNYAASYFNDLDRFLSVLAPLLRPGARAVVVLGNSIIQGIELKVDQFLAGMAAQHGLQTEAVEIVRKKRVGSSIVDSSVRVLDETCRTTLYDAAVVLSK